MKPSTVFRGSLSIISLLGKIKKIQEEVTPAELVDIALGCPAIQPQQLSYEFVELAKLVKKQQCKFMLEIGTYRGGTLFVFSQLAEKDAKIISIDFSMTFLGNFYRAGQWPLFRKFIRKGQSLFLLRKDSHKPETLASIERVLQGHKLDFLFIDGDHTYQGVRKDFEMYSPLVRSGGLVAFHDITPSGEKEVYKFWDEVKSSYTYKEFIHRTGKDAMGIGVLWIGPLISAG
jgi:predicted O-methyltransferase YrrM